MTQFGTAASPPRLPSSDPLSILPSARPASRTRGAGLAASCGIPHTLRFGLGLACLGTALATAGCSDRNTAGAEVREVQLTEDQGWNTRPRFSRDGERLAFSRRDLTGNYSACVMPAAGGERRAVTPDSASYLAAAWDTGDGALFVLEMGSGERIRRIDLEGRFLEDFDIPPLSRLMDVDPAGGRFLLGRFQGDNVDFGIYDVATGSFTVPHETPEWELDGCFGPGAEDITLVTRSGIAGQRAQMGLWSPATGTVTPLPIEKARLEAPVWSVDGRYLAYASDPSGSFDVFVFERETGRVHAVTSGPEDDMGPSWSPDGERLAFARRTSYSNIYLADTFGEKGRALTAGQSKNSGPILSQDGEWVAFIRRPTSEELQSGQETDLCLVPAAGGEIRRLHLRGFRANNELSYCWSRDGRQIAFAAVGDESGDTDVYRVSVDTGDILPVTVSPGSELVPTWSKDGSMICYTRIAGGETEVYAIPSTGGIPVRVSRNDGINQYGIFSHDGERIAYMSIAENGDFSIWVTEPRRPEAARQVYHSTRPAAPAEWAEEDDVLLVWQSLAEDKSDRYVLVGVPLEGGEPFDVARPAGSEAWMKYLEPTPAGERFRELIYPVAKFPYSDGESISEIFTVRVGEILRASLPGS